MPILEPGEVLNKLVLLDRKPTPLLRSRTEQTITSGRKLELSEGTLVYSGKSYLCRIVAADPRRNGVPAAVHICVPQVIHLTGIQDTRLGTVDVLRAAAVVRCGIRSGIRIHAGGIG